MNTVLVWILMSGLSRTPTYSPPLKNLAECLKIQNHLDKNTRNDSICVLIEMVK